MQPALTRKSTSVPPIPTKKTGEGIALPEKENTEEQESETKTLHSVTQTLTNQPQTDINSNPLQKSTPVITLAPILPLPLAEPVKTLPQLTLNTPGDEYEQEADKMAEQVVRMHQFTPPATPGTDDETGDNENKGMMRSGKVTPARLPVSFLQRKTNTPGTGISVSPDLTAQIHASRGAGSPLPEPTRRFMEGAFRADLSRVRIHKDAQAATMSKGIHARAFTYGDNIYFGEGAFNPESMEGKRLLAHELTHTLQQGRESVLRRNLFDMSDPLGSSWYQQEQAQARELEAAETGDGRQATIARLAAMTNEEARQNAPGIAYRAQTRGDIELALIAADRLLDAWLSSTDYPAEFSAGFGAPDDRVDRLIERAETAFNSGHWELGGKYLSTAMVQLVRAANAAVQNRPPVETTPENQAVIAIALVFQRDRETRILERIQRIRELRRARGAAVTERGDASEMGQFEEMSEAIDSAEQRAGPSTAEDLGTGGAMEEAESPRRSVRGSRRTTGATETSLPDRPEATARRPVTRAAESVVDSTHPDLEGALVFFSTSAPRRYGNIRSPRYGIAGTFAGAHRLGNQLFGRRSSVIVEDTSSYDDRAGARRIRYIVAALNNRIIPPDASRVQEGQNVPLGGLSMLTQPAGGQYFFVAVITDAWHFFRPSSEDYIEQIRAQEAALPPQAAPSDDQRRQDVFAPIDALIEAGEIQQAANQLTLIGAAGFALVDTATKARYISVMLQAFTFQENEETIVEVFRAIRNVEELRAILQELHRQGLLHQLHADMENSFLNLLLSVGQRLGGDSVSSDRAMRLLHELRIFIPFPGVVELRADGSGAINLDITSELDTAVEELVRMIFSTIEGVFGIIIDPATFFQGLYQLGYFAVMVDLARRFQYPPAVQYVSTTVSAFLRQLNRALSGLAVLQENMPEGEEFIRDLQRSIEWRMIWEVVGMFVGVGEVVAFTDAVRTGRAAEFFSGMSRVARTADVLEEGSTGVRALERIAGSGDEVAHVADDVADVADDVPAVVHPERGGDVLDMEAYRRRQAEQPLAREPEAADVVDDAPAVVQPEQGGTVTDMGEYRRRRRQRQTEEPPPTEPASAEVPVEIPEQESLPMAVGDNVVHRPVVDSDRPVAMAGGGNGTGGSSGSGSSGSGGGSQVEPSPVGPGDDSAHIPAIDSDQPVATQPTVSGTPETPQLSEAELHFSEALRRYRNGEITREEFSQALADRYGPQLTTDQMTEPPHPVTGDYPTTDRLRRGLLGERLAVDALTTQGHEVVLFKPDILGTNQGGIDIVTILGDTVYFIDNKAFRRSGNIGSVSALTTNFPQNRAAVIAELNQILLRPGIQPDQVAFVTRALDAINSGRTVRAVTGAAGNSTGVTARLGALGIIFIPL